MIPPITEVVCAAPDCEEHFLAGELIVVFTVAGVQAVYHLACGSRHASKSCLLLADLTGAGTYQTPWF